MHIFKLFHFASKNTTARIKDKRADKPEWSIVEYKTYERFPSILLSEPKPITTGLSEALQNRVSGRTFSSVIDTEKVSNILYWSLGSKMLHASDENQEHKMYPSAGARFPLEVYVIFFVDIDNLKKGVYHYDSTRHSLSHIPKESFDKEDFTTLTMYGDVRNAKFAIVVTAVFERTVMKYGERGYRFALLEAGCATHNVTLTATTLGVESVHMGGVIDTSIEKLLDIDGSNESYVHSVFLG